MTRRTDFQKAITYTGQKIKGPVDISLKIDGVRILRRNGVLVTRNDKQPPGLLKACNLSARLRLHAYCDCEIYTGKFHDVNGPIHQHDPERAIFDEAHVYPLVDLDKRLHLYTIKEGIEKDDPFIQDLLKSVVKQGYEGLVLRGTDKWYRVKPSSTADVRITGWFEQVDKEKNPKGVLGGFTTNYGRVTAFTDELRKELWENPDQYIGQLMEVVYKELYDTGKFRYCVTFSRFRNDKEEESFDTKNI